MIGHWSPILTRFKFGPRHSIESPQMVKVTTKKEIMGIWTESLQGPGPPRCVPLALVRAWSLAWSLAELRASVDTCNVTRPCHCSSQAVTDSIRSEWLPLLPQFAIRKVRAEMAAGPRHIAGSRSGSVKYKASRCSCLALLADSKNVPNVYYGDSRIPIHASERWQIIFTRIKGLLFAALWMWQITLVGRARGIYRYLGFMASSGPSEFDLL